MDEILNKQDYENLHTDFLVPLNIKIENKYFLDEIKKYKKWNLWGDKFQELNRYALPLVNLNGNLYNDEDPSCWPLDRWNFKKFGYKDTPSDFNYFYNKILNDDIDDFLLETSFKKPTSLLNIPSLNPLNPIKKYMHRSCILKWQKESRFYPHVDTWYPVRWLRIWGTSHPENIKLRFKSFDGEEKIWNDINKEYENYKIIKNIEPGRLYIFDSIKWHDAICIKNISYHYFISLSLESYDFLKENIEK